MKHKNLGELEKKVMDIMWDNDEISVRDVTSILQKKNDIAYTTIATILDRLHDKKLVTRSKTGKSYTYKAAVVKEDYISNMSASFLDTLFSSFGEHAVPHFIEGIEKLSHAKRKKLLEELEKYDSQ